MALLAPASRMMPSAAVARPATIGRPFVNESMNKTLRGSATRARKAAKTPRSACTDLARHSPRTTDPVARAIKRIFSTMPSHRGTAVPELYGLLMRAISKHPDRVIEGIELETNYDAG